MPTKPNTDPSSNQNSSTTENFPNPADYESAVAASGFGRFNVLLLLAAVPAAMATIVETAAVSYILASAECDLNLDLLDKGILNAVTYIGMISSSVVWGYLGDTKGRKNILIFGLLIDFVCTICSALSQNFIQFVVTKFFGGFAICGPFAVLIPYLSEFHGTKHREQIVMLVGVMFSTASILMPVVATLVLPSNWHFSIFNMDFTSWKLFLAIFSLPSLISGIAICFLPESPRFLMSKGRNHEALNVFKMMYSRNTGNPKDSYPIKELVTEVGNEKIITVAIVEGALDKGQENSTANTGDCSKGPSAFKALFSPPYLGLSLRVYLMNFFILLGQVTMRLWSPQLFASLHEYKQISSEATSMCTILEYNVNKTALMKYEASTGVDSCVVVITSDTYTNNIIVSAINFMGFLVAGTLVNWVGQKRIQVFGLTAAGICGFALYWSSSTLTTLIITAAYICMGSIAITSTIGTSVNLFPTSLRTMIVSLSWMFGRMGSITGNILFPIFMTLGCVPPFAMVGSVMLIGCLLGAFLPNTKNLHLK